MHLLGEGTERGCIKMGNNTIKMTEAIRTAVRSAGIENDDPLCTSAVYENGLFDLVIYTMLQKYEFYVNGSSREVVGMISEPISDISIGKELKA